MDSARQPAKDIAYTIDYLIEADRPNPVDRAIVMAQILLETLSYSWLVVERSLWRPGASTRTRLTITSVPDTQPSGGPMTSPEHYRKAEELTDKAHEYLGQGDGQESAAVWATVAQIHATGAYSDPADGTTYRITTNITAARYRRAAKPGMAMGT